MASRRRSTSSRERSEVFGCDAAMWSAVMPPTGRARRRAVAQRGPQRAGVPRRRREGRGAHPRLERRRRVGAPRREELHRGFRAPAARHQKRRGSVVGAGLQRRRVVHAPFLRLEEVLDALDAVLGRLVVLRAAAHGAPGGPVHGGGAVVGFGRGVGAEGEQTFDGVGLAVVRRGHERRGSVLVPGVDGDARVLDEDPDDARVPALRGLLFGEGRRRRGGQARWLFGG